jgi:hypothetical protein
VTTAEHLSRVSAIGARIGKPVIQITMRQGLFDAEWALFRGDAGYVLVADPRFARMTRDYLSVMGAVRDIHVLVAGRDDTSGIPDDAPVYATQAARKILGVTRLPKGLLPPARMISDESVIALLKTMLEI